MPPANKCVSKVINISCRLSRSTNRKGWNIHWSGCRLSPISASEDQAFYHDRHSFEAVLDLNAAPESVDLAEAERLAEDLRLLYVALTRSVWHCSLGVAPLVRRRGDKR